VVLASPGYPDAPRTGGVIEGLEVDDEPASVVLHAGTALDARGSTIAAGGRVLSVVGTGHDLTLAREAAYRRLRQVRLDGGQHRTDIAQAAAEQQRAHETARA
jgi:phosphoribosylamine--glycine ligase